MDTVSKATLNSAYLRVQSMLRGLAELIAREKVRSTAKSIDARLKDLHKSMDKFINYSDNYENSLVDSVENELELTKKREERYELETQYYETIGLAETFVEEVNLKFIEKQPQQVIEPSTIIANIENDNIKIPLFEGVRSKWNDWKAYYIAAVHEKKWSSIKKMAKLRESLGKKPAELIENIALDDNGYNQAWKLLTEHYENKRIIIKEYIDKLLDLPPLKTPNNVEELLINVKKIITGLQASGCKLGGWGDLLLVQIVIRKLDSTSRHDLEIDYPSRERLQTWEELKCFLEARAAAQAASTELNGREENGINKLRFGVNRNNLWNNDTQRVNYKCHACTENHRVVDCNIYREATIPDRQEILKKANACNNCLNKGHKVEDCRRTTTCFHCNNKHHTSLHPDPPTTSLWYKEKKTKSTKSVNTLTLKNLVILPTAQVIITNNGKTIKTRCLLDSCSQCTLISSRFIKNHKIATTESKMLTEITGIGGRLITTRSCKLQLNDKNGKQIREITAIVSPSEINYRMNKIPNPSHEILEKIDLADNIYKTPELNVDGIDLLLGADIYDELLLDEGKTLYPYKMRNSKLGWIIANNVDSISNLTNEKTTVICLEKQLQHYWELDEPSTESLYKNNYSEEHFQKNTTIDECTNKFVVRYPFLQNKSPDEITGNHRIIKYITEKSAIRLKSEKRREYEKFLKEYEMMGHMEAIDTNEDLNKFHFIPHHPVFREASTTTKLRVVFNASWINKNGCTLNDYMHVGPIQQPELVDTLLRFRTYKIAFSADVEKMFRCINIHPEERKYQCIFDLEGNPYKLNTVTYGTSAAPFLATRCLKFIADNIKNDEAAAKIISSAYMDDILGGGKSCEEVIRIWKNIHNELKKYGFILRKYQTNNEIVLKSIPAELVETNTGKFIGEEESLAILGICWAPKSDILQLQHHVDDEQKTITKRKILSDIARVFDPLNIAAPVTVRGKLLMQKLWKSNRKWDEKVDIEIVNEYTRLRNDLKQLCEKVIPRFIGETENAELIGFCDASLKAYGAVVYLRTTVNNNTYNLSIIAAKSRVAPIKSLVTIPKLELQAALELTTLIKRIANEYSIDVEKWTLFSDSKVALDWIAQPWKNWNQYVKNRVLRINEITMVSNWRYCETKNNPADLLTRGIETKQWAESKLWFEGPPYLKDKINFENVGRTWRTMNNTEELEHHISFPITSTKNDTLEYIQNYSNIRKAIRVLGYVIQFIKNCQGKFIDITERNEIANISIYRMLQMIEYNQEYKDLDAGNPVHKNSNIIRFNPYMDQTNKIIRSASRLRAGPFSESRAKPIILPANSIFIRALVQYLHKSLLHATTTVLEEYLWNFAVFTGSIRKLTKSVVHNCIECIKRYRNQAAQIMAELPNSRLLTVRAFYVTGVDCAGPFQIKCTNHRSYKIVKYYLVVFICFSSRAVHLEIMSALSTDCFLMALDNFINRRGRPSLIYSDNGTNFQGAVNNLNIMDQTLQHEISEKGLRWKFNPPNTPHRGGLWEAAVKAAKRHLVTIFDKQSLTAEQFTHVTIKTEAILNSRPLLYRPNSSDDQIVVT